MTYGQWREQKIDDFCRKTCIWEYLKQVLLYSCFIISSLSVFIFSSYSWRIIIWVEVIQKCAKKFYGTGSSFRLERYYNILITFYIFRTSCACLSLTFVKCWTSLGLLEIPSLWGGLPDLLAPCSSKLDQYFCTTASLHLISFHFVCSPANLGRYCCNAASLLLIGF
jgi:hypothetical protein